MIISWVFISKILRVLERKRVGERKRQLHNQKLPSKAVDSKLCRHWISGWPLLQLLLLFPWEMWGRVGEKSFFKRQFKILQLFTETCHRVEAMWVIFHANVKSKPFEVCFLEKVASLLSQMIVYLKTYCTQHWVIYYNLTSNYINSECVLVRDIRSLALCFFSWFNNVIILNLCLINSL